jgi:uncharacterized protein
MRPANCCRRVVAVLLIAILADCSSPNPALYMITPTSAYSQGRGPKIIVLQQVGLANYLRRSEIVRSSENYRLAVMANDWWGEPLSDMLTRVLIEEMSQRLPQSTVLSGSSAVSASPDATVEVEVARLDEDSTGRLVLQATASVTFRSRERPTVRSFHFTEIPPVRGTAGEVAAISTAVGQLANGITSMLLIGHARR